ncbi:DNA methyltransferase, partial [Pluralibacter gergoviae]
FTGLSTLIGDKIFTKHGTEDIDNLFNMRVFDFPKPVSLLKDIITQGMGVDDIVLDFFAGSGTTAHSVMKVNAEDNGRRKFILVQLPEVLSDKDRDQKTASDFCDSINKPRNIAELTKERLRRAGKKVQEDNPHWNGDVGFRVFKLDTSNIRPWEATAETLSEQIDAYVSPILEGRSEEDLLTELMLKRGIDLSVNIEIRQFDGLTVSCVDGGKLFTCFAKQIPASSVEELTKGIIDWHKSLKAGKDTVCYFLDDAFENNIAKTNLCAILEQHGLTNLHSL